MKRWIANGLTVLLAVAVMAAGAFSIDMIKALFSSNLDTITTVDTAEKAMLLYMDTEEDLLFYPWTTYRMENTISVTEFARQNALPEEDAAEQRMLFNDRVRSACSAFGDAYVPQENTPFHGSLRYQPSNSKAYLPSCAYTAVDGQTYLLDMVLNGRAIEAIHITPQKPLPVLSNDERIQCVEALEKEILHNRDYHAEIPAEVDSMAVGALPPSVRPLSLQNVRPIGYTPDQSMSASPMLLDGFSKLYYALSENGDSLVTNEMLTYLLFTGVYQIVYYENEILLFFLPDEKASNMPDMDPSLGLLLYIHPQSYRLTGFNLLNLNA